MKVVIVSGKSGSGKDTFAKLMKADLESQGKKVMVIHYGDLVKYFAHEYFGYEQKNRLGRSVLQTVGTDIVRAQDSDYWAECVARFIAAVSDYFDYCFIPDARFPNEIKITKKYNKDCITVRIHRLNADGTNYVNPEMTEAQLNHESENSLNSFWFDYVIYNSAGLDKLLRDGRIILENEIDQANFS